MMFSYSLYPELKQYFKLSRINALRFKYIFLSNIMKMLTLNHYILVLFFRNKCDYETKHTLLKFLSLIKIMLFLLYFRLVFLNRSECIAFECIG